MNALTLYLAALRQNFLTAWDRFWFAAADCQTIARVRVAACLTVIVCWISWLPILPRWIGTNGMMNSQITTMLNVGNDGNLGAWFRLSPLYWIHDPVAVSIYCVVGLLVAVAMLVGIGGRVVAVLNWALVLSLFHRVPILTGPAEPLLSAVLLYLIIDQGKLQDWLRPGYYDEQRRVSANIALRLLQVHTLGWIAMSVLNQLAGPIWWQGDSAWWLSVANRSLLSPSFLYGHAFLINFLTHTTLLSQMLGLVFVCRRITRPLGVALLMYFWMCVILLSGDWFYALVGATACCAYCIGPLDGWLTRSVASA